MWLSDRCTLNHRRSLSHWRSLSRCFNKVRHLLSTLGKVSHQLLQQLVLLGSQLLDNVGEQVLDSFSLRLTSDDKGIVLDGRIG
jgi:hypothetical protein